LLIFTADASTPLSVTAAFVSFNFWLQNAFCWWSQNDSGHLRIVHFALCLEHCALCPAIFENLRKQPVFLPRKNTCNENKCEFISLNMIVLWVIFDGLCFIQNVN